jgi:H+/Cl- antiporter ClcA
MGQIVRLIVRAMGSTVPVSLTSYSVVGAAAYMGGATRMTLTTTVMVMETTGALQLIVPLMITVFFAKVCSQVPLYFIIVDTMFKNSLVISRLSWEAVTNR